MTFLIFAISTCLIPLVLFLVGAFRVRGWKNDAGRAVMLVSSAAGFALGFGLARALGYMVPDWVRAIIYLVVGAALWWQYLTFARIQREGIARERRRIEREELRQSK